MDKFTDTYRSSKLIELRCGSCILRVQAWKPFDTTDDRIVGVVDVQVISNAQTGWNLAIVNRIKNAWKVLRGSYDWSGFELLDPADVAALIEALREVMADAFPE